MPPSKTRLVVLARHDSLHFGFIATVGARSRAGEVRILSDAPRLFDPIGI